MVQDTVQDINYSTIITYVYNYILKYMYICMYMYIPPTILFMYHTCVCIIYYHTDLYVSTTIQTCM